MKDNGKPDFGFGLLGHDENGALMLWGFTYGPPEFLDELRVGDIFRGPKKGFHYRVTKTGAKSGLSAVCLETGKKSAPWTYDKVAPRLIPAIPERNVQGYPGRIKPDEKAFLRVAVAIDKAAGEKGITRQEAAAIAKEAGYVGFPFHPEAPKSQFEFTEDGRIRTSANGKAYLAKSA